MQLVTRGRFGVALVGTTLAQMSGSTFGGVLSDIRVSVARLVLFTTDLAVFLTIGRIAGLATL